MSRDKELKTLAKELLVKSSPTVYDQYDEISLEARDIFIERNALYGNAFEAIGLVGNIAVLIGDVFRLRTMCYRSPDLGRSYRSAIRDKLLDIVNQAIIGIMTLDDDNFTGK